MSSNFQRLSRFEGTKKITMTYSGPQIQVWLLRTSSTGAYLEKKNENINKSFSYSLDQNKIQLKQILSVKKKL